MSEANEARRCNAANVVLNELLDEFECDPEFPDHLVRDTLIRVVLDRDEEIGRLTRLNKFLVSRVTALAPNEYLDLAD